MKMRIIKPKKPNSANRKAAKVKLFPTTTRSGKKKIVGYIAGFGNSLREHSEVLVRGGNVPDLPYVHYRLIKGQRDFDVVEERARVHRRSLFGLKKAKAKEQEVLLGKQCDNAKKSVPRTKLPFRAEFVKPPVKFLIKK